MIPTALEETALRLAAALGESDCALIGGLAVAAHGYVCATADATADVDFVVRDLEAAGRRLREHGSASSAGPDASRA